MQPTLLSQTLQRLVSQANHFLFFNLLCTKSFKQGLTEREGRIGIFFIGRDRGSTKTNWSQYYLLGPEQAGLEGHLLNDTKKKYTAYG